jgi:hypothetical protein
MSTFDELNKVFDISSDIESTEPTVEEDPTPLSQKKPEIQRDYEHSRNNLYDLIEKGQRAIEGALDVAQSTDHPRAYEVAGNLIKQVADVTDKLVDLQKKMKDIDEKPRSGPTNVTNALFVGSTTELSKLIKQQKQTLDK